MERPDLKPTSSSLRAVLSLSWQSVAYGIGVVGSQVIVYLMLPLLTHYMSREEYGAVSVVTALYAFLNTLTNAGLPSATFRFYNDNPGEQHQRLILGASQFLFFCFAAIPAAGIVIFSKPISELLLGSVRYALALQLAAGFLVADTMNFFGTIILRILVRPLLSSVQGIILVACETGMAVFFVVVRHMGVAGYWLGFLIGEIVGLIFTIWLVRKFIVFQVAWEKVWDLMRFGIPLIPTQLSLTALRLADRYIIGSMVGLEQVAIYDVGYKIGSVITLILTPFKSAWSPFAFAIARKPEASKVYRDVLTYLAAACSFLILGVIAFRAQLVHIVAPASYAGATGVVSWVAASQLFMAVYIVLSLGPMIANRTHHLAWASISAAGLNLLLNILLIPAFGILGAAIATFIGYLALLLITYFVSKRSFPLLIDWNRAGKLLLASSFVALIIILVERLATTMWMKIGLKIAALMSFPILLLVVGFVSLSSGRDLVDMGRNMLKRKLVAKRR